MFKRLMEGLRRRARKQHEDEREDAEPVEVVDPTTGEITVRDPRDEEDDDEEIEDDRGSSSVNRSLSLQARILTWVVMGAGVVVVLFALGRYYVQLYRAKTEEAAQTTQTDKHAPTGMVMKPFPKTESAFGMDAPDVPPPQAAAGPASAAGAGGKAPPTETPPATQPQFDRDGKPILTPEQLIEQRKRNSKVTWRPDSGSTDQLGTPTYGGSTAGSSSAVGTKMDGYADDLKPTYLPGVKAQVIPDRNLFITRSRSIGCLIDEAIQTSVPGSLSCTVVEDVRGQSGQVVLLDKGTILTGTYKADLKGKDSRLFVVWERAETPTGVIVELASPSGDGLGRAGIGLAVDTHFMERFSSGMLISVVGDGAAVLQARSLSVQGNNNAFAFPNTTQGAQALATEAIKQNSGIPNTGVANQARYITVYVARDLDFRGVYKLEPTANRR